METMQVPDRPATDAEVGQLMARLHVQVGVTNGLGVAVLALSLQLFDPPAAEQIDPGDAVWALGLVVPLYGLGEWGSVRLIGPLLRWLRQGSAGEPAPRDVQRRLLALPALRAVMLLGLWLAGAGGLATAHVALGPEEPVRAFVATFVGVAIAGVTVSTLSFLIDQRLLAPWYGRFLAGDDPTRLGVVSSKVRRRLLITSVLGGLVPMLFIGGAVSERLDDPGGVGQLEAIVWFLIAVGVGVGSLLALLIRDSIVRPLEHIRRAAERVRAGDLSVAVPVESADELGELSVAFNAMVEGLRERRQLEDMFGRHVGAAVAERALREGIVLGGERRTVTVLLIDLTGFTELAERNDAEAVVDTLNRVFAVVVREVTDRGGLVNKFMGDAVLAVFGAPLGDPDHADHAVDAARAIAASLAREGVGFGIGVSTGPVVAGNVGAEQRFEYTVVGDAVNEAARLQELTRERGVSVLMSGRTAAALGAPDGLVTLDPAQLRGRTEPTDVYGLA